MKDIDRVRDAICVVIDFIDDMPGTRPLFQELLKLFTVLAERNNFQHGNWTWEEEE